MKTDTWNVAPYCLHSVSAGQASSWRTTGRHAWTWTSAPPASHAASAASTPTAPTSACAWTATRPSSGTQTPAKPCQVSLPPIEIKGPTERQSLNMCRLFVSVEEPFLIMADHHEIRKLSVDGSNYTILKQVSWVRHHCRADFIWGWKSLLNFFHSNKALWNFSRALNFKTFYFFLSCLTLVWVWSGLPTHLSYMNSAAQNQITLGTP